MYQMAIDRMYVPIYLTWTIVRATPEVTLVSLQPSLCSVIYVLAYIPIYLYIHISIYIGFTIHIPLIGLIHWLIINCCVVSTRAKTLITLLKKKVLVPWTPNCPAFMHSFLSWILTGIMSHQSVSIQLHCSYYILFAN